jgi:hypothetical protein
MDKLILAELRERAFEPGYADGDKLILLLDHIQLLETAYAHLEFLHSRAINKALTERREEEDSSQERVHATIDLVVPGTYTEMLGLRARVQAVLAKHRSTDDDDDDDEDMTGCGLWHECSIIADLEAAING